MLNRELGAESNGKLPHLFILSKTAILVPEFALEVLPLGKNCSLGTRVYSEVDDDGDDDGDDDETNETSCFNTITVVYSNISRPEYCQIKRKHTCFCVLRDVTRLTC